MSRELKIVNLISSRDEKGLSLLYSHYSSSLFGIALRTLGNKAFAEDAMQKSFLKIWNHIDQYDESKSTLFTWMARIVTNTSIDIRRLKSFQKEEKTETYDTTVHNIQSVDIAAENLDALKMIDGLDEKYAFVINSLYLKGYTQSELSKETGIPLGTIKTRVKKGLEILRSKLDKEKKYLIGILLIILLMLLF